MITFESNRYLRVIFVNLLADRWHLHRRTEQISRRNVVLDTHHTSDHPKRMAWLRHVYQYRRVAAGQNERRSQQCNFVGWRMRHDRLPVNGKVIYIMQEKSNNQKLPSDISTLDLYQCQRSKRRDTIGPWSSLVQLKCKKNHEYDTEKN